ncbi:MAG: hypothetical protein KFBDDELM_00192 [Candidatus Argoarchaeum ethanivorans]|uniref:Uncharacterized protein n=1 Tax=Candidatus Argoarchaeum ethanivorans TaxID=2608793 RepID=A0A811T4I1_9EURY|nr:MAG: hypothetical protein KFBDDELM_00192 [Candidatus Argoarchaeum ethanivorans]
MASDEWYKNRIEELKFQKEIRINQDNRTCITLVVFLPIVFAVLQYELSNNKDVVCLILLYVVFSILQITLLCATWYFGKENRYPENKEIQNYFDLLLDHKK